LVKHHETTLFFFGRNGVPAFLFHERFDLGAHPFGFDPGGWKLPVHPE
jgi:hypothetical protein